MDVHAVRDLADRPQHQRADGGDVDLHVLVVMPRRRPLLGEEGELVVAAVMLQRALAAEGRQAGLHRLHVVLHLRRRLVEGAGVSPDDVGLHLAAEAEAELALGVLRQLPGDLGRDHRAAREGERNAGREMQRRRGQRGRGDVHPRDLVALGEQHAGEAGRFHSAGQGGHVAPGGGAGHDVEFHGRLLRRRRGLATAGTGGSRLSHHAHL